VPRRKTKRKPSTKKKGKSCDLPFSIEELWCSTVGDVHGDFKAKAQIHIRRGSPLHTVDSCHKKMKLANTSPVRWRFVKLCVLSCTPATLAWFVIDPFERNPCFDLLQTKAGARSSPYLSK
jgi:hypothetical protein